MNDELCLFVEGDVHGWRGLPALEPLRASDLPDCLGTVRGTRQRAFVMGTYNVERREREGGGRVDVYAWWGDGRVIFLDVWPVPGAASALGLEPRPEASYVYGAVERDMWEVDAPAEARVEELVWGSRGLSMVTARMGPSEMVKRIRGFAPMRSDVWIEGFVKFTATPET